MQQEGRRILHRALDDIGQQDEFLRGSPLRIEQIGHLEER